MTKCPKCKKDITELEFDVTGTCSSTLRKSDKDCCEAYDLDALLGNVEFDNFRCPECDEVIVFSEEEAKQFLNGSKTQNEN